MLRSHRVIALFGLFLLAGFTGCKTVVDVPEPPPPGTPTSNSIIHSLHLMWSGSDYSEINSLTLSHPWSIRLVDGGDNDLLDIVVRLETQKTDSDALVKVYQEELQKNNAATIGGGDPKIQFPARTCLETFDEQGRLSDVKGICVRDLIVTMPSKRRLGFELSFGREFHASGVNFSSLLLHLQENTVARMDKVSGPVSFTGGGNRSSVLLDQLLSGDGIKAQVTAQLSSIANFFLTGIAGEIMIDVKDPTSANVEVDYVPIKQFPYHRQ